MSDVLGVLQSPSGEKVKVVTADSGAINHQPVVAFATLTDTIVVAINKQLLLLTMEKVSADSDEPDEDSVNLALIEFVPAIVVAASNLIDGDPATDPFGLAQEADERDQP